ncbi:hypothetical protein CFE53_03110 [Methanofervidicoccus sp. A16]|uniref:hypothetical protein n=1 Tax=Methanofervidicoccus sp. A16 TaxID=2607662 RepID=UPI001189251D|nr:hypothetical protein [Methanofervidicoccus sp. A16]AXI25191.1 hypothetical protein CFE53_03110 [Methanofervidicoccus sp. A16]
MEKESIILTITIILVAIPITWLIQYYLSSSEDVLAKYDVHHVEFTTINGRNVSIVYQIKNLEDPSSVKGKLDVQTKTEICYIVWYIFNKYPNVDEVQIISYYSHEGRFIEYYKFKIDRRNAELAGLLNISKEDLANNIYHYYNKLIKLGKLKVHSE